MSGEYRVKNGQLQQRQLQLTFLLGQCNSFTITHVGREENQRADELANMAYDNSEGR